MELHHRNRKGEWECIFCGKNFDKVQGLKIHIAKVHEKKLYAVKNVPTLTRMDKARVIEEEKRRLKKYQTSDKIDFEKYKKHVVIKDGTNILLRPITPDDEELMLELFHAFSKATIYKRWFHLIQYMSRDELRKYVINDYEKDMALLAVYEDFDGELPIGVGRYAVNETNNSAEVAFVVRDDWQNRGVGTVLLDYLTEIAKKRGLKGFTAEVLTDNETMLHVFQKMGFFLNKDLQEGTYRVRMFFDKW